MVRQRSGQSTVEMMLYTSVIVVVMVLSAWIGFGPAFKDGWDAVAAEQSDGEARIVTIGERNGVAVQTAYILDEVDPTRLLVRTRLDRVTEAD